MALVALVATLIASAGSGYAGWTFSRDYHAAKHAEAKALIEETARVSRQSAADEISKIQVKNVRVTQQLETQVRELRIPADCTVPDSVLALTNATLTGQVTGDGGVPAADPDGEGRVP